MKRTEKEACFLILKKNEHKYLFKYSPDNTQNLFFALLAIGRDKEHALTLCEVFALIRKISKTMEKEGKVNMCFEI